MWARHMELALGLWMAVSPFALRHDPAAAGLWLHDYASALVLVVVPLLAHWRPARYAHLALLAFAAWLIGAGWWQTWTSAGPLAAAHQNWILVGLTVAMLAVIPTEPSRPPEPYRRE